MIIQSSVYNNFVLININKCLQATLNDSDRAHLTSFEIAFNTKSKGDKQSLKVVILCSGLLRIVSYNELYKNMMVFLQHTSRI